MSDLPSSTGQHPWAPQEQVSLDRALEGLAAIWRAYEVDRFEQLRPGLNTERLAGLSAEVGFRLPPEASTWFGWRDGSESPNPAYHHVGGSPWRLLAAREAVAAMSNGRPRGVIGANAGRSTTWLPILERDDGAMAAIDCSRPSDAASAVRAFALNGPELAAVPSVNHLVQWWLSCHTSGLYEYDLTERRWNKRPEAHPAWASIYPAFF